MGVQRVADPLLGFGAKPQWSLRQSLSGVWGEAPRTPTYPHHLPCTRPRGKPSIEPHAKLVSPSSFGRQPALVYRRKREAKQPKPQPTPPRTCLANRQPLTAHRSPLTAHRSPLTAHCSLLTAN